MNSYETSYDDGNDGDSEGFADFTAALQFIDNWDATDELLMPATGTVTDVNGDRASHSVSSRSDDPTAAGSSQGKEVSAPTGSIQRRGQRRPVDELRKLRREEFELSTRLEALRLDARRRLAQVQCAGGQSDVGAQAGFWQRAAVRQFEYRKYVEGENARLRVLVQAQIRKAKYLRQMFLNRTQRATPSSLVDVGPPPAPPADNDEVFAKLLATIDEDYLAAIEALDSKRATLGTNFSHASGSVTVNDALQGDDDVLLEYFADTTAPFPLHTVENAVWLAFAQRKNRRNPSFQREFVEVSGDLIKSSAHLEIKLLAFHLLIQVRIVARKYVERNRKVVVLKTFVEPSGAGDRKLIGMLCYETSVRVLTPVDSTHAVTRMETYATLRREVLDGPSASFWRHDFDMSVAKMVWGQTQLSRNELVENLLVDESMRRC